MAKTRTVFTVRPEIDNVVDDVPANLDVQRKLSLPERLLANAAVRRVLLLLCLAVIWELYALHVDNPLLFPRFSETLVALWNALFHGPLLERMASSLRVLLMGYGIGIALAGVLVTFAVSTAVGQDLLTSLTAMFNPLPAIALLPLAMLWFGLGQGSLVFVIVHSVLWAVALNALSGFTSVNETLRMSGQNYGLRGVALRDADPDPRRAALDPLGAQDRLGVRLAHADRGRARVRRHLALRRPRLVHLRKPQRARDDRRCLPGCSSSSSSACWSRV